MGLAALQPVKDTSQELNNRGFHRELQAMQGQVIDISDSGVGANTDFNVLHTLGFIPQNAEVLVKQGQSAAYITIQPGATAWTSTQVTLKCNTANAAFRLRLT